MPNPLSRWIKETPRGPSSGRVGTTRHDDSQLLFRQLVERWVEFKRLHLGFAQTLNSLLNGNSSPIFLIKQSMLCAHDIRVLRQYGSKPEPGTQTHVDTLAQKLPLHDYETLYTLINSGTLDDKSLECLVDKENMNVAQAILKVTGEPIARLDNYFIALADQDHFAGAERVSKWTPELTVLHKTIVDIYTRELKERDLL